MSKNSADFEVIDDEEMLNAIVAESKAKTLVAMESGLKSYLKKMGKDATFKGWVAHDYPENTELDHRLKTPYNNWELVWTKVTNEYFSSKKNPFHSLFNARGIRSTKRGKRKNKFNKKHSRKLRSSRSRKRVRHNKKR